MATSDRTLRFWHCPDIDIDPARKAQDVRNYERLQTFALIIYAPQVKSCATLINLVVKFEMSKQCGKRNIWHRQKNHINL